MITLFVHSSSTSAVCNGSSSSSSILATASIFKAKHRTSQLRDVKHTELQLQSRMFPAAPQNLLPTLLLGVAVRTIIALWGVPFTLSSWAGREWWQGMGSAGPFPDTLCIHHSSVQGRILTLLLRQAQLQRRLTPRIPMLFRLLKHCHSSASSPKISFALRHNDKQLKAPGVWGSDCRKICCLCCWNKGTRVCEQ